ncbi:hypothetical protein N8253_00380 [Pelagibacterales bacterium]|nr:hypothetical protein [Pelagibacterales bacterium]
MKNIKDASIIFLIVFIIASTLYGIHMFRYSFIELKNDVVIRYDRITNTQCMMISDWEDADNQLERFRDRLDLLTISDSGFFMSIKLCYDDE